MSNKNKNADFQRKLERRLKESNLWEEFQRQQSMQGLKIPKATFDVNFQQTMIKNGVKKK